MKQVPFIKNIKQRCHITSFWSVHQCPPMPVENQDMRYDNPAAGHPRHVVREGVGKRERR
ncbi:unnamed protein product [Ixodes pacificus]